MTARKYASSKTKSAAVVTKQMIMQIAPFTAFGLTTISRAEISVTDANM
jgi:hypothetical protein